LPQTGKLWLSSRLAGTLVSSQSAAGQGDPGDAVQPMKLPSHSHLAASRLRPLPEPSVDLGARFPSVSFSTESTVERFGLDSLFTTIASGEVPDFVRFRAAWHVLSFLLKGETRANWRRGQHEVRRICRPGTVAIIPAGDDQEFRCSGRVEVLVWAVNPAFVQSIAERELERPCGSLELIALYGGVDDRLWELGRRMASELQSPRYASRLYFDTLNTQLAICLVRDHSSLVSHGESARHRIEDMRIRKAIDFIHANLSWNITLEELADETGLSQGYLVAAFKEATGRPPHRYLLEQRVERAKVLLADPNQIITQIALDVGFSSQSHLTSVFRRLTGVTPNGYRNQVLGLA
jgi:AraC family transcriptional regulator